MNKHDSYIQSGPITERTSIFGNEIKKTSCNSVLCKKSQGIYKHHCSEKKTNEFYRNKAQKQ